MNLQSKDLDAVLESLAFQAAAETAVKSGRHRSVIGKIARGGWQAAVLRKSPNVTVALNPSDVRMALENPAAKIIFLPQQAMVTAEILENLCAACPLDKTLVWEDG